MMRYKNRPYAHQQKYLNELSGREFFALLAEMGTGKTFMIINEIAALWGEKSCDSVLVFCPKGVVDAWILKEIKKHTPDWVRYRAASWSATAKKDQKWQIQSILTQKEDELRIFIVNYDALCSKKSLEIIEKFCQSAQKLMIVCDESDSIKNPKAERTKRIFKLKKYSKYRRIMSGTPLNNSPLDLYSQFCFLDEHILQSGSFYSFKAEYCELLQEGSHLLSAIQRRSGVRGVPQIVSRGTNGKPIYKNLDKLAALIAPHSYRVLKKDCLDLPAKVYKTYTFDLSVEQRKVYTLAEQDLRLAFEQEETAFNKLSSLTKCCQITSGYYLYPDQQEPVRIEGKNAKLDLLRDLVEKILQTESKIIIWAKYRVEIEDICAVLKQLEVAYVEYHGGVKDEDRRLAIDDFEKGEAKVFVGNQKAGGVGITLVAASHMIFYSNSYSLRDRIQAEDRAHRIGQKKSVVYISLAGKDTIDEKIIDALQDKKELAEIVLD